MIVGPEKKDDEMVKEEKQSKKVDKKRFITKETIESLENGKGNAYGIIAAAYKEELVPIPDTEKMIVLEELSPGSINKIIGVSVETIKSTNDLKGKEEKRIGRDSLLGLIAGFLIAILFLLASWDLVRNGHEVAGTILGTIDLVALVTVFVSGRK